MPKKPITADDLWALPRVGAPIPNPQGTRLLVPVTTFDEEDNEGTTRLYLVSVSPSGPFARPLTTAEVSSGQACWSPDATQVAFVRKPGKSKKKGGPKHGDVGQLYVMPVDGGEPERLTDLPLGVAAPKWFPGGDRIAFVSHVYRDASSLEDAAKRKEEIEEDHVEVHATENRFYRYWDQWLTDEKHHHLFVLDLVSRELQDLTPNHFGLLGLFDPDGQVAISPDGKEVALEACRTEPPYSSEVRWAISTLKVPARIKAGGRVGKPKEIDPGHVPGSTCPVYSPDGRYLVYGIQEKTDFYADKMRLVAQDRETGERTVLTEEWEHSAAGWRFAPGGLLWLVAEVDARTALFTLDVARAVKRPGKVLPQEVVRGGSYGAPRPAGRMVFAGRSSLCEPPEVFSIHPKTGVATRLTFFTEEVMKRVAISAVQDVRFEGHGGDEVQMYLLYPPGEKARGAKPKKGAKRFPLVHMIHGGPHGTFGDVWHWRWNAQAFAAPGYLVACVNFHGSTSWGQEFAECIQGRWGDQPAEDIHLATDELIRRGLVNKKRMAITGGSYGGYLVSWLASQTDRFACIVNHAGVSDFQTQYASDFTYHRARAMGGEPWDRLEGMDTYNPLRHAAGFKSPMLVIHGMKDYRVPYNQGLAIYNIYKAMGLPARLVVFPKENHWILEMANSKRWYQEFLTWLDRWIGKRGK